MIPRLKLLSGLCGALLLSASPAYAACDANNTYSFLFSSQPAASLNYANTYTYTAANPLGATQSFTTSFGINGMSSTQVAGAQMPAITNLITTSTGTNTLMVGGIFTSRTANITTNTRTIRIIFTFPIPIRDLAITVHDIDFASNQYRDWFHVTGSNGVATYTPALSTPHGTNNGAGPRANASSSLTLGTTGAPYNLPVDQGLGVSTSPNNGVNTGDILLSFAQPVTSVTLRYGNYPLTAGETNTGQQAYGVSAVRFCPMPSLAISKTSAPFATTGPDRFNAPGSDVVYTIVATNNGGSPVDLDSLQVADLLPPQVTFYNGDFDPLAPGTDNFQFVPGSSGVSMSAANVAYSNNGGSTYAYVPSAGYDANVNAVQFSPTGSLAANASFTLRFRAQIK